MRNTVLIIFLLSTFLLSNCDKNKCYINCRGEELDLPLNQEMKRKYEMKYGVWNLVSYKINDSDYVDSLHYYHFKKFLFKFDGQTHYYTTYVSDGGAYYKYYEKSQNILILDENGAVDTSTYFQNFNYHYFEYYKNKVKIGMGTGLSYKSKDSLMNKLIVGKYISNIVGDYQILKDNAEEFHISKKINGGRDSLQLLFKRD